MWLLEFEVYRFFPYGSQVIEDFFLTTSVFRQEIPTSPLNIHCPESKLWRDEEPDACLVPIAVSGVFLT